jgi:hypothetical protein
MAFPSAVADTDDAAPVTDTNAPAERPDDEILTEIRDRLTYAKKAWEDVRVEGAKDLLCVAGQPWEALDPAGLAQRKDAGRPAIACDELGQYINQIGNDVRQNKRAIKATPTGNGANDKTAEFKQNLMRQIEYESNAQREVYSPVFEDALQRSYGYGRVKAEIINPLSRNMRLRLEAFPNPDVVTPDPDGAMLSPDLSKIKFCFITQTYLRKAFKREFHNAQVVDFGDDHARVAPDWIRGDGIQVAEYWTVENVRRRVVFLKIDPSRGFFEHKLPRKPGAAEVVYSHWVDVPYVCQYLTNGIELLVKEGQQKRTPWPGASIPVFGCYGKILYVPTGTGTERRIMSMPRLARDPYMLYCYTRTCQQEVIGSVPRATFVGYEGQFRGHENEWNEAAHVPKPFLVARPTTEATGAAILPLPVRQNWDPPLQNLEMQAEAFRRAIQAAMGTSPLPTEAQRQNQKSGKALDRIESSGQKGSYHFVDHLDGMITRVGAILDELIPHYYDTARDVTVRKPDDQSETVRINDPEARDPLMLKPEQSHDITLSVGPAEQSQRTAASDFADTIVGNTELMQFVGPEKGAKLIAQAIRLKSVGPVGDQMAETIDPKPPEEGAPPTPDQVAQLQAQGQQLQQALGEAQQAMATDQAKQQGQIEAARIKADADAAKATADADLQWKIAQLNAETELEKVRMQEATKLQEMEYTLRGLEIQAEIDARQAALGVRQQAEAQAHEADMAGLTLGAKADEAERSRAAAAESGEAERAHAAEMAEAQAARDAAMGAES